MKFMSMKRFGAAAMAGALALSLSAPAFAAAPNTNLAITSTYQAVDLAVTVPTTGTAQINPYGLPVDLKKADNTVGATIKGEQITNAVMTISNESNVALAVSATVTGTETGAAKLVSDLTAGATDSNTPKNVVAQLEVFAAPGIDKDSVADDKLAPFAALKSEDAALTAPVLTSASATTGSLILREGDGAATPGAQDGGVAFVRVAGQVVKNPTTPWATTDGFSANVAFTFEPAEYVGEVTLTAPASVAVDGTGEVTVTMPSGVTAEYATIKWTSSKTANVTVANATTAPTGGATTVSTVKGTLTGVKSSSTSAAITVEFEGSDGIIYRGTVNVKCG